MASFFNISSRFGRGNKPLPKDTSPTSATSSPNSLQPPSIPQLPHSPSLSATISPEMQNSVETLPPSASAARRQQPYFSREEHSGLIVKGNFMTLAAKPEHVDLAEWLAHQVVEQYRLLDGLIKVIQESDRGPDPEVHKDMGLPICNRGTCPTMSAGGNVYTWLDTKQNPVRIPAHQYIELVTKWINGKILDPRIFPTDTPAATHPGASNPASGPNTPGAAVPIPAGPTNLNMSLSQLAGRDWLGRSAGFPESFERDIKSLYRQMCRCYAHIYWGHWLEPFYHLGANKELNTCFVHFVNVGRLFELIDARDLAPMDSLVDIWINQGLLPANWGVPQQEVTRPVQSTPPVAAQA